MFLHFPDWIKHTPTDLIFCFDTWTSTILHLVKLEMTIAHLSFIVHLYFTLAAGSCEALSEQRVIEFFPGDGCGTKTGIKEMILHIEGPKPFGDKDSSLECGFVSFIVTKGSFLALFLLGNNKKLPVMPLAKSIKP